MASEFLDDLKKLSNEPFVIDESPYQLCAVHYCTNTHDHAHYYAGCGNIWVVCKEHEMLMDDFNYIDWLDKMDK